MKRLKELEHENSRLKRMYGDLSLKNAALKDVLAKTLRPVERREVVTHLVIVNGLLVQRACYTGGSAGRHIPGLSGTEPGTMLQ